MKIYAISDLHLSFNSNKPMDIFGYKWENYLEKITDDWNSKVKDEDIVLIPGDISWAMKIDETKQDFAFLEKLKGKKVIIRGNHDYWWTGISAVRKVLPKNIFAIQNDAIKFDNVIICGTRGWAVPETEFESEQDEKIYKREVIRLELSLQVAKSLQKNNETIICMIHYPPTNSKRQRNEFTDLFEKYNINKVVFGHLHGKKIKSSLFYIQNNIEYYLTSCDLTDNKLVLILNS
ncbi:MAG: metallophosphoesterase [Clostridia bacterium]|nr:metallophosphoesterase [Clostridia bacterium]